MLVIKSWKRFSAFVDAPLKTSTDRVFLALALVLLLGNVLSWRYHFTLHNYAPFIQEQVMPREGGAGQLSALLGQSPHAEGAAEPTLESYPYSSPLPNNEDPLIHRLVRPAGSDFLAMWHSLRVIEAGSDPYRYFGSICYNPPLGAEGPTPLKCQHVPSQVVGTGMTYLPFGPFLVAPFSQDNYFVSLATYLLTLNFALLIAALLVLRSARAHRLPLAALLVSVWVGCHPLDVLIDRGNTEGLVLLLMCGFYALRAREREMPAALCLGLAAASKIFPGLLIVTLLPERRFKAFAMALGTFLGANALALLALPVSPTRALSELAANLGHLRNVDSLPFDGVRFGQSADNFVRVFLALVRRSEAPPNIGHLGLLATALGLVLLGWALSRIKHADFVQRAMGLSAAMLLIPSVASEYHLVHLLPPFALGLLQIEKGGAQSRRTALMCLLVALIFVPKGYFAGFKGLGLYYGLSPLLNPLLLLALIVVALMPAQPPASAEPT